MGHEIGKKKKITKEGKEVLRKKRENTQTENK